MPHAGLPAPPDQEETTQDAEVMLEVFDSDSFHLQAKDTIVKALQDVRSNECDRNWLVLKYGRHNKELYLAATGSEYKKFLKDLCDDKHLAFGYAKVDFCSIKQVHSTIFIQINWVGKQVTCLKKIKVAQDSKWLKQFFKVCDHEYTTEVRDTITYERVAFAAQLHEF